MGLGIVNLKFKDDSSYATFIKYFCLKKKIKGVDLVLIIEGKEKFWKVNHKTNLSLWKHGWENNFQGLWDHFL